MKEMPSNCETHGIDAQRENDLRKAGLIGGGVDRYSVPRSYFVVRYDAVEHWAFKGVGLTEP